MREASKAKITVGFALTLIVVIVGAAWVLSDGLSGLRKEVTDSATGIRKEVYDLRLELVKEYATKEELVKVRADLDKHKAEPGHKILRLIPSRKR